MSETKTIRVGFGAGNITADWPIGLQGLGNESTRISTENIGRPARRNSSHIAGAGRNPLSAAMPSCAFTAFTRMRTAWLACPSS